MAVSSVRLSVSGAMVLLVTACASSPEAPPRFDVAASLESQIDTFVYADKATRKRMKSVNTLALTGCNVLFATRTRASASTGSGMFGEVGNTVRSEAKISQIYTLEGLTDADMQAMADGICADAETRLLRAGYAVKPYAEFRSHPEQVALAASGRAAPLNHSVGSGGTKQEYRVFTRAGETVHGAAYLGTAGGLAQAFKSAGGTSSWNHEARLMQDLGADSVQIDVMVDFATVESSGHAQATQVRNTNRASVSGDARLSISGQLRIVPLADLKCWERFGKKECGQIQDMAKVTSRLGLSHDEPFYDSLVDATKTGDKVASGVSKALSTLAMLGGVSGSSSSDVTRYTVTVNPDTYGRVASAATTSFVDMAVLAAKREGSK